jgi:UDP-2,4-diacetamido-2,4,6-trideoxy-beta-L-altropyranose hydrolase
MRPLLIRADGHRAIGAGHVMRCLALASAWRARGGAVTFITFCDSDALAARLRAGCDELVRFGQPGPSDDDRARLRAVAAAHPGAIVVLDGYGFTAPYHHMVRTAGHPLLVLDDHAHLAGYDVDWILNQNTIASPALYHGRVANASLLLGPSFALLRGEFAAYRDWLRSPRSDAHKLLVTLGGSDPDNVTRDVVLAVATVSGPDTVVRVVAGHSNAHAAGLKELCARQRFSCEVLQGVDDMPAQMIWADLAISAAGSTIWELAYMQLPALLITTADNQGTNAAGLQARSVARDVGRPDGQLGARLAASLRELAHAGGRLTDMATAGRALVDGRGAERVVDALLATGARP